MNVSSATHTPANAGNPADQGQLSKSCREFESNLWRQVLEKALSPLLSSGPKAPGADVYTYFLSSTIAERVSGGEGSFSNLLQAQLAARKPHQTSSQPTVCNHAAIR